LNRRRRAVLLILLALVAAGIAMSMVRGYSSSVVESYGAMRPVIVVTSAIERGEKITPAIASEAFQVRRVPVRFAPAGSVASPGDAIGYRTAGPLLAGSYLTANLLKSDKGRKNRPPTTGPGRHAVELAVSGAGALTGAAGRVDVLVTTEPRTAGTGRTYVAARGVPLIGISRTGESDAGPGLTQVTLALTRREAIELVEAESFARKVTVIPGEGGI
jgi:Flp pilus assembly protein CpaB